MTCSYCPSSIFQLALIASNAGLVPAYTTCHACAASYLTVTRLRVADPWRAFAQIDLYGFIATALAAVITVTTGFARADLIASWL
jgi:hypothetical protein